MRIWFLRSGESGMRIWFLRSGESGTRISSTKWKIDE